MSGPLLPHRRDHAQLLHYAKVVAVPPVLDDLAAFDTEDVDACGRAALAPVGGMPKNSPLCVPPAVKRSTTFSPST